MSALLCIRRLLHFRLDFTSARLVSGIRFWVDLAEVEWAVKAYSACDTLMFMEYLYVKVVMEGNRFVDFF